MPTNDNFKFEEETFEAVKAALREVLVEKDRQILTFSSQDDATDFEFQCASRARGLLETLATVLDGIRNQLKYCDTDHRAYQVLDKVRDKIWSAACEAGVDDLMEEWGCGDGGSGNTFELPPMIDVWDMDNVKLDPGVELRPDGKIFVPRRPGEWEPEHEGPQLSSFFTFGQETPDPKRIEIGYVEWVESRRSWHGFCKAAKVWTPLEAEDHDTLSVVVRQVVDLHGAAS